MLKVNGINHNDLFIHLTGILVLNGSSENHKYNAVVRTQKQIDARLKRLYTKWHKRHPDTPLTIYFKTTGPDGTYPGLAASKAKYEFNKAQNLIKIEAKLNPPKPTEPEQTFQYKQSAEIRLKK